MSFLTAVFSYNRGQLLWNCVRALERFCPETAIVVLDDHSEDPATQEVLGAIAARGHEVLPSEPTAEQTVHGALYANMNRAMDLARERGHRIVHMVQDDVQFVWRNDRLEDDVVSILDSFPHACHVGAHFWRRLGITDRKPFPEQRAYSSSSAGALGFVDVQRMHEHGFRFGGAEREWSAELAEVGLEAYHLADPVVARVPWPNVARRGRMHGDEKLAVAEFFIKPLSAAAQAKLRSRPLSVLPYGEDFYEPWGWRCWRPYPISPSYASWLKSIAVIAGQTRSVRGLVPRRVGAPLESR
jgi:hypothetical protein